jgi:arginase family enzyme
MDEVHKRGFSVVLKEAVDHVSQHTIGYGVSLDLDSVDPSEAPGVDVPEPNGLSVNDLMQGLKLILNDRRLLATELVEFDPSRDRDRITEKLAAELIGLFCQPLGVKCLS